MTLTEAGGLFAAAAVAGVINAIAGGGTLVTFPVLLAFGISPVVANATSTVGLFVGTGGSIWGYRRHLEAVRPWLLRFLPVSLAGSVVGSALLVYGSERVFSRLVPFLILFATLLFMLQGTLKRMSGGGNAGGTGELSGNGVEGRGRVAMAIGFQFLVAIYGGYFGAGIGILMLATFGFLGLGSIHEMNTLKTVLGSLINVVAAVAFVVAGLVDWPRALVMTVGALAGYWLGAHSAQRIPAAMVRKVVTGIGLVLAALTFWKEFVGK